MFRTQFSTVVLVLILLLGLNIPSPAALVKTIAGQHKMLLSDGWVNSAGLGAPTKAIKLDDGKILVLDKVANQIRQISPEGYISGFAGSGIKGYRDGSLLKAHFNSPHGMVKDSQGNIYISDQGNHCIRKITPDGIVSTYVGNTRAGFADGFLTEAKLNSPAGLAIDQKDNIYVADQRNHSIRKINPRGDVSTIAGSTQPGYQEGEANQAKFYYPEGVAVDNDGNIYVADKGNNLIRKISDGIVSTYPNTNPGSKPNHGLLAPTDLVVDSAGLVYFTDLGNHSIKVIDHDGNINIVAGKNSIHGFKDGDIKESYFNKPHSISLINDQEILVGEINNYKLRSIELAKENKTTSVQTLIGLGKDSLEDGADYQALLNKPTATAYDSQGNLYIADSLNHCIRKLSPDGVLTTVAGNNHQGFINGGPPGASIEAELNNPFGIVVDSKDNVVFSDLGNHCLRKLDTQTGLISTLAGTKTAGFKDGQEAMFNKPSGLAIDSEDNIYVADSGNHRIRKVSPEGFTSSVSGSTQGNKSGDVGFARFNNPTGITFYQGDFYITDQGNHTIRKISSRGYVTTLTGLSAGYQDGLGKYALFNEPSGIAAKGNKLFITDSKNNRIRVFDLETKVVSTLSGSGEAGHFDSDAKQASFNNPQHIAFDQDGNFIISDSGNNCIRKINSKVTGFAYKSRGNKELYVDVIAGDGKHDLRDGLGKVARLNSPHDLTVDQEGNIYIADTSNHAIRKIDTEGNVTTIAGSINGYKNGFGTQVKFNSPRGIDIDNKGNIYVADTVNNRIRKILKNGQVINFAGNGLKGFKNDVVDNTMFNHPSDVLVAKDGTIYIADSLNHCIRKIQNSQVKTFAGNFKSGYRDGHISGARFFNPQSLVQDEEGNIYVADSGNNRIRKISPDGVVSTIAGSGAASFKDHSNPLKAQFNFPSSISFDAHGDLIVADTLNNKVRKISKNGMVKTIAGFGAAGFADSTGDKAVFDSPKGVVSFGDKIYVADSNNNLIRVIRHVKTFAGEVLGIDIAGSAKGASSSIKEVQTSRPQSLGTGFRGVKIKIKQVHK